MITKQDYYDFLKSKKVKGALSKMKVAELKTLAIQNGFVETKKAPKVKSTPKVPVKPEQKEVIPEVKVVNNVLPLKRNFMIDQPRNTKKSMLKQKDFFIKQKVNEVLNPKRKPKKDPNRDRRPKKRLIEQKKMEDEIEKVEMEYYDLIDKFKDVKKTIPEGKRKEELLISYPKFILLKKEKLKKLSDDYKLYRLITEKLTLVKEQDTYNKNKTGKKGKNADDMEDNRIYNYNELMKQSKINYDKFNTNQKAIKPKPEPKPEIKLPLQRRELYPVIETNNTLPLPKTKEEEKYYKIWKSVDNLIGIKNARNNIINEWDTSNIGIILHQNDKKVYDNMNTFIKKQLKANKPVYANLLMAFTKDYNNELLEKYSVPDVFKGIKSIVDYITDGIDKKDYESPLENGEFDIIKGINMKNRQKLYDFTLSRKKDKNLIEEEILTRHTKKNENKEIQKEPESKTNQILTRQEAMTKHMKPYEDLEKAEDDYQKLYDKYNPSIQSATEEEKTRNPILLRIKMIDQKEQIYNKLKNEMDNKKEENNKKRELKNKLINSNTKEELKSIANKMIMEYGFTADDIFNIEKEYNIYEKIKKKLAEETLKGLSKSEIKKINISNNIINGWNDRQNLGSILKKNDISVYNKLKKYIDMRHDEKQPIFMDDMMEITNKYNQKLMNKYDPSTIFKGLVAIAGDIKPFHIHDKSPYEYGNFNKKIKVDGGGVVDLIKYVKSVKYAGVKPMNYTHLEQSNLIKINNELNRALVDITKGKEDNISKKEMDKLITKKNEIEKEFKKLDYDNNFFLLIGH